MYIYIYICIHSITIRISIRAECPSRSGPCPGSPRRGPRRRSSPFQLAVFLFNRKFTACCSTPHVCHIYIYICMALLVC